MAEQSYLAKLLHNNLSWAMSTKWLKLHKLNLLFTIIIMFLSIMSFTIISNRLVRGLPNLPLQSLHSRHANLNERNAGVSLPLLSTCPSIFQRASLILSVRGLTLHLLYRFSLLMTVGQKVLMICLRCFLCSTSTDANTFASE